LRCELFNRVQPLLHIFGHIHEGYGYTEFNNISFVNASICNANYMPINRPIVIDIIGKIVNYIDNI
jgi:Icc-related predicted phosphoesterase